jgi:hypothetical protein
MDTYTGPRTWMHQDMTVITIPDATSPWSQQTQQIMDNLTSNELLSIIYDYLVIYGPLRFNRNFRKWTWGFNRNLRKWTWAKPILFFSNNNNIYALTLPRRESQWS